MESIKNILSAFENFLESIPLEQYREELLSVKTVEQDLPRSLNPIPAIYDAYWTEVIKNFPSFENFFDNWWESKLSFIDEFVRKYFWGCSWEFIRKGFKARLYRTTISVLTQFHFCYTWKLSCLSALNTNSELDLKGIDAEVNIQNTKIALQIKKETYRSEANTGGRFANRQHEYEIVIEIPYTLTKPDEWLKIIHRARSKIRKSQAELFYLCAYKFQRWLKNDFVIFDPEYPKTVEEFLKHIVNNKTSSFNYYTWDILLEKIKDK